MNPFRIAGEALHALQAIEPILQYEIAVVHLPARPQLILESRADIAIRLLLPVPRCQ